MVLWSIWKGAGKIMENFELFEKVTGRVSLKNGKILEATLKEACRKTGAQYHEAADGILISGSWGEVSETQKIISSRIRENGRTTPGGESSSSSDYSEGIDSKSRVMSFDTKPQIAKFMKTFHDRALKNIEQTYRVKISWSKDYTNILVKDQSVSHYNDDSLNAACDKFAELYRVFHNTVKSIPFDISSDGAHYGKDLLKTAVNRVPQYVPGVILEQSGDGSVCNLWGTIASLDQAKLWIDKKLGVTVDRPRSSSPKGPPKDALYHETVNKLKVVVYQGDITKENADVIVNACNKHLDHAGGVSHAISKAGGPSIQNESDEYVKKHGCVKTGDVAITKPGFLHCKYIIHAVGPRWKKHGKEGCIKLFRNVFMNVYEHALKVGAQSIAMPAISSGIYGVPKDVCAQAAFSFADEVDQKLASDLKARPFEIRLVNIDGEIVKAFITELEKWQLKGRKMQRRHSFDAVIKEDKKNPVERKSVDDMDKTPRFKAPLAPLFKRFQRLSKDGGTQTSKIKHGSGLTSMDHNSATVIHGSNSAGTKVKETTSATTLQDPNDPSSANPPTSFTKVKVTSASVTSQNPSDCASRSSVSSGPGTSNARFISSKTFTPSTSGPSYQVAPSTNQSSSQYDKSSSTIRHDQNGIGSHSPHSGDDSGNCTICFNPYTDPVTLSKCGHTFCKSCIKTAFTYQTKCPICQQLYGVCEGDQPDGTMEAKSYHSSLPGYEGYGCYVITYDIPSGRQGNRHPNPGHKFSGTRRQAYLPATKEGTVVLKMLRKAFEKKLIFTVGRSNTTGKEDCVTWNDIHHKTSMTGGPQNFGYPDPAYLGRVKEELKAKGIVPE